MRKVKRQKPPAAASQLRQEPFGALDRLGSVVPLGDRECSLYQSMRESVPILDAAISKLVRLTGGFSVKCGDPAAQRQLTEFLRTVPCGRGQFGIDSFLSAYLDSLLTYGRAIGEVVVSDGMPVAVCWGDVTKLHVQQGESPLDYAIGMRRDGEVKILPCQELLLFTTLNPEAAHPYGVSLLRSMPFLTDILLKIYTTIGVNWERAGNVRYSVVYKPHDDADRAAAGERAEEIASAWSAAMQDSRHGVVRDFVSVGDVEIKVIGADGQVLNSEVPVRQILEQLVAKTGIPPFMLGLSWASTERMSSQQADMLTSELWAIRRAVEPALRRICSLWLRLSGYGCEFEIQWDEISLQDTLDEAHAALYRAQTAQLEEERDGN